MHGDLLRIVDGTRLSVPQSQVGPENDNSVGPHLEQDQATSYKC